MRGEEERDCLFEYPDNLRDYLGLWVALVERRGRSKLEIMANAQNFDVLIRTMRGYRGKWIAVRVFE